LEYLKGKVKMNKKQDRTELKKWLIENCDESKYENISQVFKIAMKKFNIRRKNLSSIITQLRRKRLIKNCPISISDSKLTIKIPSKFSNTISVNSIMKEFNIPMKIKEIISKLNGELIYDDDLRRELKLGVRKWSIISKNEEFSNNKLLLPNRRYIWGCKKSLDEIRKVTEVYD